jgi:hypothetical protein
MLSAVGNIGKKILTLSPTALKKILALSAAAIKKGHNLNSFLFLSLVSLPTRASPECV